MKWHLTKEQCYDEYLAQTGTTASLEVYNAFVAGWYAAGSQINNGEDSDGLQERLIEDDFLRQEANEIEDY